MTGKYVWQRREIIQQIYKDCGSSVFNSSMTSVDTRKIRGCREDGWVRRGKMTTYPGCKYPVREWQLTELGVQIAKGERKR